MSWIRLDLLVLLLLHSITRAVRINLGATDMFNRKQLLYCPRVECGIAHTRCEHWLGLRTPNTTGQSRQEVPTATNSWHLEHLSLALVLLLACADCVHKRSIVTPHCSFSQTSLILGQNATRACAYMPLELLLRSMMREARINPSATDMFNRKQ